MLMFCVVAQEADKQTTLAEERHLYLDLLASTDFPVVHKLNAVDTCLDDVHLTDVTLDVVCISGIASVTKTAAELGNSGSADLQRGCGMVCYHSSNMDDRVCSHQTGSEPALFCPCAQAAHHPPL